MSLRDSIEGQAEGGTASSSAVPVHRGKQRGARRQAALCLCTGASRGRHGVKQRCACAQGQAEGGTAASSAVPVRRQGGRGAQGNGALRKRAGRAAQTGRLACACNAGRLHHRTAQGGRDLPAAQGGC